MNLEARVQKLERRMDAFESTTKQSKRKVAELDESDDFVPEGAGGASVAYEPGLPPSSSDEALLQQVLTHFKSISDLEWARKISVTQADPSKLDAYFTVLVQSLVIGGYVDSFTAWQYRLVMPKQTMFKQRAVDTYHLKNLVVLMNLQTKVKRGKQASEAMMEILKQRSTYEKVMDLVRRVARGEKLVYEPTFAALNLEASAPKRASTGGRKKLFVQKMMDESDDDNVFGVGDVSDAEEAAAEEAEETTDEVGEEAAVEEAAVEEAAVEEAEEVGEAEEAEEAEGESDMGEITQPQPATQVPPVEMHPVPAVVHSAPSEDVPPPPPSPPMVSIEKVDLFAVVPSAPAPVPVAAVTAASNPLRRFMAKKLAPSAPSASSTAPSVPIVVPSVAPPAAPMHPMMSEMAALTWEPLDVNRHSMVQLPTGACDSYMNWRKAFDADPRVENRYVEYTRANGERSSVINFYVRLFTVHQCPLVEPAESVTTMGTQVLDSIYARWIATLTKSMSLGELRESLL